MGKSVAGGTRSYLRGRVGSDVYSIGRNAKGKKQQVVRSLAEQVNNPQTQSQMRGRMIMSTIMQAMAALKPIIDHSFDGLTGKQPNISAFISRNYALIKADVLANPASGNHFGLNKFQEKGAKRGQYVISDGQAQLPAALVLTASSGVITITMASNNVTGAGLRAALGLAEDEYFTLVGLTTTGEAAFERFRISPELADATSITSGNISSVFATEGNAAATIAVASNVITITLSSVATCCAVIISKKTANGYVHNEATLGAGTSFDYNANAALPTYPVGSADYLNGGDIFGQSESFNDGGSTPTPAPATTYNLTIEKAGVGTAVVSANDSTIENGGSVEEGAEVTVTVTPVSSYEAAGTINGSDLAFSVSGSTRVATFTMPSQNSTLYINTAYEDGGGHN